MVITPAAGGTPMQGQLTLLTGVAGTTLAAITAGATVTFTGTSAIGDCVDMYCDGTIWYVQAISKVAAGLSVP
jgi:hypothetical protein